MSMFVELPGVRLHYRDTGGAGIPVVFLHPQTGTARIWDEQVELFAAKGYRCIVYDRRGWGQSKPIGDRQPGYSGDDLRALVEHLELPPFHLIGSASGGIVALDYALRFGDSLRSLVLDNSYGGVQEPDYQDMMSRVFPKELGAVDWHLKVLSSGYRMMNPKGTARWREISEARSSSDHPKQSPRSIINRAALAEIEVPILALCGEASIGTPPVLMRKLSSEFQNCELVIIEEAGQAAFWEQPETWSDHIQNFTGRH